MGTDQNNKKENNVVDFPGKATFEEAIAATGFGKFNVMLLFFIIPSSFTQACEQMALSYVLPVAECDLQLTLQQKGLLNAITFAGMISSGLLFGIICDTFGRKKLIVYGYLLHSVCSIAAATSTSITQLLIAKFFCGFIFNGPFSATTTYLSEFHSSQYRARVQLIRGVTYSFGFFILPMIAWIILPLDINIALSESLNIHSWNIFLLCCACTPLITAIFFTFMPESPKFLMTAGKNEEALKIFQKVYSLNSGKPKEDFLVKELVRESKTDSEYKNLNESIRKGWLRIYPNFKPPQSYRLILVCSTALSVLMGLHTIKLWLPQILQLTNDYQKTHNGSSTNVCAIINILTDPKNESVTHCQVSTDNSFVYINSMIINGTEIVFFIISGFFVNWLGKTKFMTILSSAAAVCAVGMYFSPNSTILITLFTMYIGALDLTGVMAITITLEMFPTSFRAIALSFHFMSARVGSMLANILFPYIVGVGCFGPFLLCCLLCAGLPFLIYMYPNTENKALQ